MDKGITITLFILVLLICASYPKRDFYFIISHANCTSPSKVMTTTCGVTTFNKRNRINGLSMLIQTSEDVYDIHYNLSVQHHTTSGKWVRILELNNLNACEFNGAKYTSHFLLIARKIVKKYSNIPEGCPLQKDKEYYIKRLKLDPEMFPSYLPSGQFEVVATLYTDHLTFSSIEIGFQVVRKSKSKNKTVLNLAEAKEK